ncbi:hypothetical protein BH23ACT6_BH23ACT6_03870 [soil metagenome]
MSLLLLDTTFLIDAERSDSVLSELISDDDEVAIAAISVAELRVGVALASSQHQAARRSFVDAIVESLPVIAYDADVAEAHATLRVAVRHQGRPRGAHDLMIAATARATRRTVVSSDPSAFVDLPGVAIRNHR